MRRAAFLDSLRITLIILMSFVAVFVSCSESPVSPRFPGPTDRAAGVWNFDVYAGDGATKVYWAAGLTGYTPVHDFSNLDPIPEVDEVRLLLSSAEGETGWRVAHAQMEDGPDSVIIDGLTNGVLYNFRLETIAPSGKLIGRSTARVSMPGPIAGSVLTVTARENQATRSFAWSPDSDRIAFIQSSWTPYSEVPGEYQYFPANIFLADLVGGAPRQLTQYVDTGQGLFDLSWSPDGTRVAYTYTASLTNSETDYRIWVANVADGASESVTDGPLDSSPAWLANGELAFVRRSSKGRGLHDEILLTDLLAPGATRVLTRDGRSNRKSFLSAHPNSGLIVYSGYSDVDDIDLYTVAVSDGNPQILSIEAAGDRDAPSWAPDGRTVVFQSSLSGHSEIWAVDVATGTVRQVTRGMERGVKRTAAAVSPDGMRIAYLESGWSVISSLVVAPYLSAESD